jgi:hypothetical protein
MRREGLAVRGPGVDHAEQVALGVLEDDEVVVRLGVAGMAGRSDPEQPLDLTGLVVGVEIQVESVLPERGSGTCCSDRLTLTPAGSRRTTQPSSAGSRAR